MIESKKSQESPSFPCDSLSGDPRIKLGSIVIIHKHREVNGRTNWAPEMDEFDGKKAVVKDFSESSADGCKLARLKFNDQILNYNFRVRDLEFVPPGVPCVIRDISVDDKKVSFSWKIDDVAFEDMASGWFGLYVHNIVEDTPCHWLYAEDKEGRMTLNAPCHGVFHIRFHFKEKLSSSQFRKGLMCASALANPFTAGLGIWGLVKINKSRVSELLRSEPIAFGPEMELEACYLSETSNKIVVKWDKSIQTPAEKIDWLGLFRVNERDNTKYSEWHYASEAKGSEGLVFELPKKDGMYEVRYFFKKDKINGSYVYSGRSNPVSFPKNEGFDDIVFGLTMACATKDYQEKDGELCFKKGDIIRICLVNSSGKLFGECNGKSGWFPLSSVSLESSIDISHSSDKPESSSGSSDSSSSPSEDQDERQQILSIPQPIVSDWGTMNVKPSDEPEITIQSFSRYKTPSKEEFLIFFNTEFVALHEVLSKSKDEKIIKICGKLKEYIKEFGKEIKSDRKIGALIIDKKFDSARMYVAPGRFFQNVERFLSFINKSSSAFVAVRGLEAHLDRFRCILKPGASLEETINYCFVLHQVNYYMKSHESRKYSYDNETIKAMINLRRKINFLMLTYCYPDEDNYPPLNDVHINCCKVLVDTALNHKIYLPIGEMKGYIWNIRQKAESVAKNIRGEVSPDSLTDRSMAVIASLDRDGSVDEKKAQLEEKIAKLTEERDNSFIDGGKSLAKLAGHIVDLIIEFCPALSMLKSSLKGLSGSLLQKLGAGLKSCFGTKQTSTEKSSSSEDSQETPLGKVLRSKDIAKEVIDDVFDALKMFLKGYRLSQTIVTLERTLNRLENGEKYVDSFIDLLRYYFVLSRHEDEVNNALGVVVSWNGALVEDDISRADFLLTDIEPELEF